MRLGFTGTRQGLTDPQYAALCALVFDLKPTEAHHGDCVGADAAFHDLCSDAAFDPRVRRVVHPPTDVRFGANCLGADEVLPAKPFM